MRRQHCEQSNGMQLTRNDGNLCVNAVNCFTALSQTKPKMMSRNEARFRIGNLVMAIAHTPYRLRFAVMTA